MWLQQPGRQQLLALQRHLWAAVAEAVQRQQQVLVPASAKAAPELHLPLLRPPQELTLLSVAEVADLPLETGRLFQVLAAGTQQGTPVASANRRVNRYRQVRMPPGLPLPRLEVAEELAELVLRRWLAPH